MTLLYSRGAKRKILALTLVFSLVFIFSLSFGYILMHADHHCDGEHCPICERIALCTNAMLHLCGEWLVLVMIGGFCTDIVWLSLTAKASAVIQTTLVLRHVRMNC